MACVECFTWNEELYQDSRYWHRMSNEEFNARHIPGWLEVGGLAATLY